MSMNNGDLLVTELSCSEGQSTARTDRKELQELLKRHACSEADSASASKHEGPVREDAPDGSAVAGGLRILVLIRLSACMFWHRFTKTTASVTRYLPPGHSECGFPAIVSLCWPKGPANLVGMLNMSHITRRYHGSPHRMGQCSQWSGVHVCLRKRACDISQQSTISVLTKLRQNSYLIQKMPILSISEWAENRQIHKPLVHTSATRGRTARRRTAPSRPR